MYYVCIAHVCVTILQFFAEVACQGELEFQSSAFAVEGGDGAAMELYGVFDNGQA